MYVYPAFMQACIATFLLSDAHHLLTPHTFFITLGSRQASIWHHGTTAMRWRLYVYN